MCHVLDAEYTVISDGMTSNDEFEEPKQSPSEASHHGIAQDYYPSIIIVGRLIFRQVG